MVADFTTSNIRRRIVLVGMVLIASPVLILIVAGWVVLHRISEPSAAGPRHVKSDLTLLTRNLVEACQNSRRETVTKLESGRIILEAAGQVRLDSDRRLLWRAKNERTGEYKNIQLPLMVAGSAQFEPVTDFEHPAPLVDEIQRVARTSATVFQRINESGDMLRVSSTEKSELGERAIGSFIPAIAQEGTITDGLERVLAGETYVFQSRSSQTSYLTAYQPFSNEAGKVAGMLATSVAEDQMATQIRNIALTSLPRDHGDFFAFEASGDGRGKAQIMADKSLEGRDLWDDRDAAGHLYVQELCRRGLGLRLGEVAEYKYQKAIRPAGLPQVMVARFAYVKELDWVVGFAQPEVDSLAGASALQALAGWGMWVLLGVAVAATGLAARVWILVSDGVMDELAGRLSHLTKDAKQLSATALELSDEAGRTLSAKRRNRGENASTLSMAAQEARRTAGEISLAIAHIDSSSHSVKSIIAAIDQITFATNLLMVNAAIKSSQTENGAESIAAVADELRLLAGLSRRAARETQEAIQESRLEMEKGSEEVLQLVKDLNPNQGRLEEEADSAAELQRQARYLTLIAEGIDQTVNSIREELGLRS